MPKISPKNLSSHKCNCCKRNYASHTTSSFMYLDIDSSTDYKVAYGFGGLVTESRYLRFEIEIPICEKCKQQQDREDSLVLYTLFITFAILWIGALVFSIIHNRLDFPSFVIGSVLVGLISYIITIIICLIIDWFSSLINNKAQLSNIIIDDYEPIKKLQSIGFTPNQPSSSIFPKKYRGPSENQFYEIMRKIEAEDNCIIR